MEKTRGKGQCYIGHLTYCITKRKQVKIINRHSENKQSSIDVQRTESGPRLNNLGFFNPK